ncbi:MAG: hypothetical protein AB7G15_15460 [Alphaproteobacteria bacterium]
MGAFDHDTLFFDVFHGRKDEIICIGPPLLDLEPAGFSLSFEAPGVSGPIKVRFETPRIPEQLASRVILTARGLGMAQTIDLVVAGRRATISIRGSTSALLAGRRVLVTLSRDNPLQWLDDWLRFHVLAHGTDAVLLYDNGSRAYTLPEIAEALSRAPGIRQVIVASWPFPYGVGGPPSRPARDNFCQTGMLDHARRCLCRSAASVLNLDVDELLVSGRGSIYSRIEAGSLAAIHFRGLWVERPGIDTAAAAMKLRHRDCHYIWRAQLDAISANAIDQLGRTKWVAVPVRCGVDVEWGIHEVYPATDAARLRAGVWRETDETIHYRHFRQINTGWKSDRWRSSPDFDAICVPDRKLIAALEASFDAMGGR